MEKFIVISENGARKETVFNTRDNENGALKFINDVNNRRYDGDENITVQRVFSVSEYGTVKHYEVKLHGFTLVLVEKGDTSGLNTYGK